MKKNQAIHQLTLMLSYLLMSLINVAIVQAAEPNSVNGKYQDLLQTLYCPQDQAEYGEFNDYGYWQGGEWCAQIGEGGYWVWQHPNWYVWAKKAAASGKVSTGTITAMQAGDVACYIEFSADDGKQYKEMATFELCEQRTLINQKVRFSYRKESVMAADCEGDPECSRSDSVWLISEIKK